MNSLVARWQRFWFEPESPKNLGYCRALFYAFVLAFYLFDDLSEWGDVSSAFWFPLELFEALRLPALSTHALALLDATWKLSLIACAVGLGTRIAAVVALVLGVYRLGLPHNFGKIHHFDAMFVVLLGVLAFARSNDAFSLDRRLRGGREPAPSGEYRWPVRAAWVVMSLTFFAAGISKLRHGGVGWIASGSMARILNQHAYQVANADPLFGLGLWFSRHPYLCALLALTTVVVEVGYPLALFNRRARLFFPPAMCGCLIGIRLLMGPTFGQFVICHLFWVPWDRVLEWLREPRMERAKTTPAE